MKDMYWKARLKLFGTLDREIGGTRLSFDVDTVNELAAVNPPRPEEELERRVGTADWNGSVFWDVGCHLGIYSLLAAVNGASVYAFDVSQRMCRTLEHNSQINGVAETVDVMHTALSGEDGMLQADMCDAGSQQHRLTEKEGGGVYTPVFTAETVIENGCARPPDAVKIDVEGLEDRVLSGFGQYLDDVSTVYVEVHREKEAGDVLEFLQEQGYGLEKLSDEPLLYAAERGVTP